MAKLIHGHRVGKKGRIMVGCSAIIRDDSGQILLTRRTDNGRWCLPGGAVDPGESVAEACAREVLEETGLTARVGRLIGVYSTPNLLIEYPDGNRVQLVVFSFEAEAIDGALGLSDETTACGYFAPDKFDTIDLDGAPLGAYPRLF